MRRSLQKNQAGPPSPSKEDLVMGREVYPSPGDDNHSSRLGHTGSHPERQALLQAHMGGTEAQRGEATCSGLHSKLLVELGFHTQSPDPELYSDRRLLQL